MFKSLREKLKGWISKGKEEIPEEEVVETPTEDVKEDKPEKKGKEKTKKKQKKEEKKSEEKEPDSAKEETKVKEPKEDQKKELTEKEIDELEEKLQEEVRKEEYKQAKTEFSAASLGTQGSVEIEEREEEKKVHKEYKETKKETEKDKQIEDNLDKGDDNAHYPQIEGKEVEPLPEESEEKEETASEEDIEKEKLEEREKEETSSEEQPKEKKKGFFASLFSKKEETVTEEVVEEEKTEEPEVIEETSEEVTKEEEVIDSGPEEEIKEETVTEEKKQAGFSLFKRKGMTEEKFDELFDELELILMQNNVAVEAVENIKTSLKEKLVGENAKADVETALQEAIEELLINPPSLIDQIKEKEEKPFIILFAGINGAGKTTTIAKVTNLLKKNDLTCCLASADTFRAAAIEQLQVHADKLDVPLVKKDYGADPASVGFDAVKYAEKNNIDVVLIDTAGRMNNRDSLMKEIEKISRVNKPDLKIFLGESTTGNDATQQAKDFNDAIEIDGIILSKADVDEKGGTAISVAQVTGKPIYYLGTGQTYDDLELFDKKKLIKKIFE